MKTENSRRILYIIITVIVLAALLIVFIPRNIKTLIFSSDDNIESVTLVYQGGNGIVLSGEALDKFILLAEDNRAFLNVIRKKYLNGSNEYIGCDIIVKYDAAQDDIHMIHLFTANIINIDGRQYRIYGSGFASGFMEFINNK